MSWYSQMIKSQELARSKNRRVAKRAESQRLGAEFVAQYRLAALDKEKRMIEKELERIRQGVHKPPKVGQIEKERDKHVLTVTSPRQKHMYTPRFKDFRGSPVTHPVDTAYSSEEKKLYGAIVFLKNNPSALVPILAAHAQSDAYLDTLGRLTPFLEPEEPKLKPIVPRYLQENHKESEKAELLNRYSLLLHRHSPILRGNASRTGPGRDSKTGHRDSPQQNGECFTYMSSAPLPPIQTVRTEGDSGTPRRDMAEDDKHLLPGHTDQLADSNSPRKKPHGHLADKDMQAPRDQISRRPSADAQRPPEGSSVHDSNAKPDDKKQKLLPKAMFPTFDPDVYNADGTLRTVHQLPNFDEAWGEAQKARYIRTKELLERDKELSVKEIFEKDDKTKVAK